MKKTARILSATLGVAALVGGTTAVASAHEGHGSSHASYASYASYGHHSGYGHTSHATAAGYGFGKFNQGWYHHHSQGQQLSFAQKQTLIVDQLDEQAAHLQTQVDRLTISQANNPSDRTAAALARAQAKQAKLQALITAVKAATDDASLQAAFKSALSPAPTAPSTTTAPAA